MGKLTFYLLLGCIESDLTNQLGIQSVVALPASMEYEVSCAQHFWVNGSDTSITTYQTTCNVGHFEPMNLCITGCIQPPTFENMTLSGYGYQFGSNDTPYSVGFKLQ